MPSRVSTLGLTLIAIAVTWARSAGPSWPRVRETWEAMTGRACGHLGAQEREDRSLAAKVGGLDNFAFWSRRAKSGSGEATGAQRHDDGHQPRGPQAPRW